MKRKSRKLTLKKTNVKVLDSDNLRRIDGAAFVPDGYGFSLNKNNCGTML